MLRGCVVISLSLPLAGCIVPGRCGTEVLSLTKEMWKATDEIGRHPVRAPHPRHLLSASRDDSRLQLEVCYSDGSHRQLSIPMYELEPWRWEAPGFPTPRLLPTDAAPPMEEVLVLPPFRRFELQDRSPGPEAYRLQDVTLYQRTKDFGWRPVAEFPRQRDPVEPPEGWPRSTGSVVGATFVRIGLLPLTILGDATLFSLEVGCTGGLILFFLGEV